MVCLVFDDVALLGFKRGFGVTLVFLRFLGFGGFWVSGWFEWWVLGFRV